MSFTKFALVGCLTLILGGCNTIGTASFKDMSAAYRSVLEEYSNQNVLLNVVRASKRMPVSFLDMPSILGSGSVGAGVGVNSLVSSANPGTVGGFLSAYSTPGTSSYSPYASLNVNTGFTFTQSSLDNAAFMHAFLSDVTVETVAALSNNTVAPAEVLYSLLIESIEIRNQKNEILQIINNNPNDANYEGGFQKALYALVEAGLTTELVPVKQLLSPPMTAAAVTQQFGMLTNAFAQPGFSIEVIKKPGAPDMYQAVKIVPTSKFCFNKQLTEQVLGQIFSDSAYCHSAGILKDMPKPAIKQGEDKGPVDLIVHLRSTRVVFDYLGALVAMQEQTPPKFVSIKAVYDSTKAGFNQNNQSQYLFVVNKDVKGGEALSEVTYGGARYSVPATDNGWTKNVLVTLAQLLSLNKVAGAIPPSPGVLIK